ncbi:hypothetical protein B0J11DRAFT_603241 [Dendryphion nanum]|uniref:Uncharacterized protein n=1 Tax=Dendryphion nanum TaxID=256645 RepID=A0A9P9IPS5_9PLEO|nr:hypothetical protein B0J11DRAFT_603241 [Dendryphion nanum]
MLEDLSRPAVSLLEMQAILGRALILFKADNLAFYFLGKWIMTMRGFYPNLPRTKRVPKEINGHRPRAAFTPDVYNPIKIVDGQVAYGDPNDLVNTLGLDDTLPKRYQDFVYEDSEMSCMDLIGSDGGTTYCHTT